MRSEICFVFYVKISQKETILIKVCAKKPIWLHVTSGDNIRWFPTHCANCMHVIKKKWIYYMMLLRELQNLIIIVQNVGIF